MLRKKMAIRAAAPRRRRASPVLLPGSKTSRSTDLARFTGDRGISSDDQ